MWDGPMQANNLIQRSADFDYASAAGSFFLHLRLHGSSPELGRLKFILLENVKMLLQLTCGRCCC